jgi:hypothetical protein
MKISDKNQIVEVTPKKKCYGGRPRKNPEEKRVPALMLRLNVEERKRLHQIMRESAWTGDPSSFVRDFVLSEKDQGKVLGALVTIEHYLTILHSYLTELEDEIPGESESIAQIKAAIHKAAQAIYNNK